MVHRTIPEHREEVGFEGREPGRPVSGVTERLGVQLVHLPGRVGKRRHLPSLLRPIEEFCGGGEYHTARCRRESCAQVGSGRSLNFDWRAAWHSWRRLGHYARQLMVNGSTITVGL